MWGVDGRTTAEWIGSGPDARPPDRVVVRVFVAHGGRCASCGRKLLRRRDWAVDHIVALANGGENRERNLQPLCVGCHASKTKADVAEKSGIARRAKKDIVGRRRKGRGLPGSRDSGWKQKIDGSWVRREDDR